MVIEFKSLLNKLKQKNSYKTACFIYKIPEKIEQILQNSIAFDADHFFWYKPFDKSGFIGLEKFHSISEEGTGRINRSASRTISEGDIYYNIEYPEKLNIPLYAGGLTFSPLKQKSEWDDFAGSGWFIPRMSLVSSGPGNYLAFYFNVSEDETKLISEFERLSGILTGIAAASTSEQTRSGETEKSFFEETSPGVWREQVEKGLELIKKGDLKKIVLSRRICRKTGSGEHINDWLKNLAGVFPNCFIFSYKSKNSVFFGASPEKLASVKNGKLETEALAGSLPRGETPEEDKYLEQSLLNDEKNCAEHRAVVDYIVSSLSEVSSEISFKEKPVVKKLSNIQHLWTPITADLNENTGMLDVLKALHPTPAICGQPWSVAMKNIREIEKFERGLFTGVVGWFNPFNNGEFAVGIRSALLNENKLYAYAGCGIVEGSNPESEFEESELKLSAILNQLAYDKIGQP